MTIVMETAQSSLSDMGMRSLLAFNLHLILAYELLCGNRDSCVHKERSVQGIKNVFFYCYAL